MYLRISCYRNKKNAEGLLLWNVLNLITDGALTAFSSYRWNAKRAGHKRKASLFSQALVLIRPQLKEK